MTPLRVVESCPLCDSRLVLRHNRASGDAFVGCATFPVCKFTEPMHDRLQKLAERIAALEDAQVGALPRGSDQIRDELRRLIVAWHPDRNPRGLDSNTVVAQLNRLRDALEMAA